MKLDKSGHIYLFFNKNTNLHKIGYSGDVMRRLNAIVSQSGCDVVLVYNTDRIKKPNEFEHKIHAILDEFRVIGEWFNLDQATAIDVIKTACIDANKTDLLIDYKNGMPINQMCEKYNMSRSGIVRHVQESGEWIGSARSVSLVQRHAVEKKPKICRIYDPFHFKRVSENIHTNGKDFLFMVYKDGKFNEYLFDTLDEANEFKSNYM